MHAYVVTIYDGPGKRLGERRGHFGSMDEAVRVLAMPDLVRVGAEADLRAIAWEEGATPAHEISYYVGHFVGADSE